MSMLAVSRHTRQSEELGRAELVTAGVVGRDAPLVAATIVAVLANVVLAGALAVAMMVAGQPADGAFAAGAATAGVGVVFAGVAGVTCQLASTARTANGLAGAVLGLSFFLDSLGNMLGSVDVDRNRVTSAWPAWLSPIGWGHQVRPFADNLWWPLALAVGTTVVLVGAAVVLLRGRDLGRGVLPDRRGRAHASVALMSPTRLVARLQRGAVLGWLAGFVLFGLVFGALSDEIKDVTGAAAEWYETFGGGASVIDAYWASMIQVAGMGVAVYVVSLLLRLHHEESHGFSEPVFGTGISRLRWLGAYAANAAVGSLVLIAGFALAMASTGGPVVGDTGRLALDLVEAALVQLPAVAVLGAATLVLVLMVPRWSVGLTWLLVAVTILVGPMFGSMLDLPTWLVNLSPFTHVPNAPAVSVSAGPVVALVGACTVLALIGSLAQRWRDLALPA